MKEANIKPRILIVDDEALLRRTMSCWFEERGFEVDLAEDGVEAVDKCEKNQYDVIALDLQMPRMDGVEAMKRIKASQPDSPIVVVTGYLDSFNGAPLESAAKIFIKPVSMWELETEIRSLIHLSA